MARKPLSLARQQDAERLKSIWAAYKDNARANGKKVTQDDVSEACGWATQGAFSAYLNARTPLNFDALIKLSSFLMLRLLRLVQSLRLILSLYLLV